MTARKRKIRSSPSDRPQLIRYQDRARSIAEGRLAEVGRTWGWLAQRCADENVCCSAGIMHWKTGRNASIGCGVWLAILDILQEEANQ